MICTAGIGFVVYRSQLWKNLGADLKSVKASAVKFGDALITADKKAAVAHASDIADKAAGYYSWTMLTNGLALAAFAMVAAFSQTLNVMILKQQNDLISGQLTFMESQANKERVDALEKERFELRTRLDSIMSSSLEGHVWANLGATGGELLDMMFSLSEDLAEPILQGFESQYHSADISIYRLLLLKNQLDIDRAVDLISRLERIKQQAHLDVDASLSEDEFGYVTVADYAALASALLSAGNLNQADKMAQNALRLVSDKSGPTEVYLKLLSSQVHYATGNLDQARSRMNDCLQTLDRYSSSTAETMGMRCLVLASQAHTEFDLGNLSYAEPLIAEAKKIQPTLPNIERGIRWRADHLLKAYNAKLSMSEGRMPVKDVTDSMNPDSLVWEYLSHRTFPIHPLSTEAEYLVHLRAYRAASKLWLLAIANEEPARIESVNTANLSESDVSRIVQEATNPTPPHRGPIAPNLQGPENSASPDLPNVPAVPASPETPEPPRA